MGTQPRMGSWRRGIWLSTVVVQQACSGEEGLVPEGAMSMGLSSFLPQVWGGKGHLLIGMERNGWKGRRLEMEGESLLCRQLRFL